jgi:GcrA cell cycle regulator
MTDATNAWTEERVERLKKLWSDGLSASQIAADLAGGVTRNAVIGKVHRLGLSGRGKPSGAGTPRPRKAAPRAPSAPTTFDQLRRRSATALAPARAPLPEAEVAYQPLPVEEVVIPMSERVTIMELRDSMCRWPLGDPSTAEFRFCGARAGTAGPYCGYHAQLAYQPAVDRRRQDRRLARA